MTLKALASLGERVMPREYDRTMNRKARVAYDSITRTEPDRLLSATLKKEIRRYAIAQLGSIAHAPWLEVFAAYRGEFVEKCLPPTYIQRHIVPTRTQPQRHFLAHTIARRTLQTDRLPDLGYAIRGALFDLDGRMVSPKDFASRVFARHDYVYLKQNRSSQGRSVKRTSLDTFEADISASEAAVLQAPITSHPDLVCLSPDGAPTLRISTAHHHGKAHVVSAYLRLGRAGETHVRSATHVRVPVDLATGTAFPTGCLADWTPIEAHPDTGHRFSGATIPAFAEAMAVTTEHHDRLPHVRLIGWDVAVTDKGEVMFYEANGGQPVMSISEAAHGPVFADLGWDRLHSAE